MNLRQVSLPACTALLVSLLCHIQFLTRIPNPIPLTLAPHVVKD
jgi:hypothetical protein